MAALRRGAPGAWIALASGALYFLLPLIATFEFSLRLRRGEYSFEAYRIVLADPSFQGAFLYSVALALATIMAGVALAAPTAYLVQLHARRLRPLVEFITLLPLVVPPVVLVFGYLRMYNSSSILPLTNSLFGTNILLTCGYVSLALPYMYRSIDTAMTSIDVRTLTEAARSLGARRFTIIWSVILPNIRSGLLSGAFLTFAIVIGEYVFAALLNRPTFGPYLQLIGAKRAYEPAALSIIAFAITWACMGFIQVVGGLRAGRTTARPR